MHENYECMRILADNVKRICKEQGKQLKDLAGGMGVDPASLTRALNGNARLDTVQKIAIALGVSNEDISGRRPFNSPDAE